MSSTYVILIGLHKLKDYREVMGINVSWNLIEKLTEALEPETRRTRKMQAVQFIVGDFIRDPAFCEAELELCSLPPTSNTYASQLLRNIERRKQVLINSQAVTAALHMDPRFRTVPGDNNLAISYIMDVKSKLNLFASSIDSSSSPSSSTAYLSPRGASREPSNLSARPSRPSPDQLFMTRLGQGDLAQGEMESGGLEGRLRTPI